MWNMTIIAGSGFSVGTVHPTVVFRSHDVTIDTGLWVIAHIGNYL